MNEETDRVVKTLLIDTCGEASTVALGASAEILERVEMSRGGGSAEIVGAIDGMLRRSGWALRELDAVGVVSGPGSFTGVRVGLATAKGLCEAASIKMIAVSRLEMFAEAVGLVDRLGGGVVALDAARSELYLGETSADGGYREWLGSVDALLAAAGGRAVYAAEPKVAELLAEVHPVMRFLTMEDLLRPVLRAVCEGAQDMTLAEANYVRRESDIYARKA
jgi:tRNA threonylcarbamoyladenosine biosynthesis protein TsaB